MSLYRNQRIVWSVFFLFQVVPLAAQWSVLEDDPRPRKRSHLYQVFSREQWEASNFAREGDLKWFRDAKYGMFVHFGLSTYKNAELSWGVCKVRKAPDGVGALSDRCLDQVGG